MSYRHPPLKQYILILNAIFRMRRRLAWPERLGKSIWASVLNQFGKLIDYPVRAQRSDILTMVVAIADTHHGHVGGLSGQYVGL